jgi:chemotaxis protein CheZ
VQRKVFRIEQMVHGHRAHAPAQAPDAHRHPADMHALQRELALVREALARNTVELSALLNDGQGRRMPRAAGELGAAVEAMEKATDTILHSAEAIGENAKTLSCAQQTDHARSLAQDIQDQLARIYEACNFQDLAGQRIGKAIATLHLVDTQLAEAVERGKESGTAGRTYSTETPCNLLNGPRLDGDSGHASQHEIDALFN